MTTTKLARRGAVLAVLLGSTFIAPGAAAQDTTRALSASLLRRLAEAADGYRTGEPVWVVASTVFPHEVAGVFADRTQALRRARDPGGPWGTFGPYATPRDYGVPTLMRPPIMHCNPSYVCEPRPWDIGAPWTVADVDSMTITLHHRSGRTWRAATRGMEVDAIFFTLSSVDKFLVPYYVRLDGPGRVARWRDSLVASLR